MTFGNRKMQPSERSNNVACGRTIVLLRNARQMSFQSLVDESHIDPLRLRRIEKGMEPLRTSELTSVVTVFNLDVQSFYSIVSTIAAKWRINAVPADFRE